MSPMPPTAMTGTGAAHPGAEEVCDDLDNDCDGDTDEDASDAATWYLDADGDGYGDADVSVADCDLPSGYVTSGHRLQ